MEIGRLCFLVISTLAVMSLCELSTTQVTAVPTLQPLDLLKWHYYRNSCRDAETYVTHQVQFYWKQNKSIAAMLPKLLYSDCFPTGCDASILLEGPDTEKKAKQNKGLEEYVFVAIDKIKQVLEQRCPGVVSCADILNLAARDAIHLAGGPAYPVLTGRKDGISSSADSVDLPLPSISLDEALAYFGSRKLNELDLTALLGAHSIGKTHCNYIKDRLYDYAGTRKPDPGMDQSTLADLRKRCPQSSLTDPTVFLDPDSGPTYSLSSSYYTRLLHEKAVLEVDQQLAFGNDTSQIAEEFEGFEDFKKMFALSMARMGNIGILTGDAGQVRKNCRHVNPN